MIVIYGQPVAVGVLATTYGAASTLSFEHGVVLVDRHVVLPQVHVSKVQMPNTDPAREGGPTAVAPGARGCVCLDLDSLLVVRVA